MTRDDRLIQQLETYLDDYEGVTTLPERVRAAVRAELPKTKQAGALSGPARYLTMFSIRTAQVALGLAVAALIVAVGAFLYSGRDVGDPDDGTPPPTTDPTPSASTASADVCEATTARATGLSASTLEVNWCAYGLGDAAQVSFTMEAPASWADQFFTGEGTLWLRPAGGGAITLAIYEGQSVGEVFADISGRNGYAVANQMPITLDGADGVFFDLSLAEGVASSEAPPLIVNPDQSWALQEGRFTRVWLVDLAGDAVMVASGEALADAVGEALSTLAWGD